jgi:hypothetical protein
MNSQASKIALAVVITAIVVGGGVYIWQKQSNTPTSTPAPVVTETGKSVAEETTQPTTTTSKVVTKQSTQPVITSPKAGSTVAGPKVTIKGTATPNASLWAYINYPATERLGINSYANGGAGIVGADGKFTLDLAMPCTHDLTVVVVAVPSSDDYAEFWDKYTNDVISEPVSFTTTGALSGICTQ